MKREDFQRKYANMPVSERNVGHHYNIDGYMTSISPVEIYRNIEKAEHEIHLQQEEIERQLAIASQIFSNK